MSKTKVLAIVFPLISLIVGGPFRVFGPFQTLFNNHKASVLVGNMSLLNSWSMQESSFNQPKKDTTQLLTQRRGWLIVVL